MKNNLYLNKKWIILFILSYIIIYFIWYIDASRYLLNNYYVCELKIDNKLLCWKWFINWKDYIFNVK